jgi:hypothetical protein
VSAIEFFLYFGAGASYANLAYLCARTASRRFALRTGSPLNKVLALLWGICWPILFVLWGTTDNSLLLLKEPSKAERQERSLAIQDWQHRASYWYELGQKAEAENDQALKWAVAENLNFLLETKPEGAKVSGLTAPETSRETADEIPATDWEKVSESIWSKREALNLSIPPAKLAETKKTQKALHLDVTSPSYSPSTLRPTTARASDGAVSFCNVCSSYRTRSQLLMEGVCRECSAEQGF